VCEIIVKAITATHSDPIKDLRGCYKRGYPVAVYPDGTKWGNEERLPKFVIIKIPGIPVEKVQKYIQPQMNMATIPPSIYRRRLWQIRWADLPLDARTKLASTGQLIIKATSSYTGTYDYTWTQIKTFFRNLETELDESAKL